MTDPRPLVTVAMPLYNGAAHLPVALRLIREQTYPNLDVVLCDDASTDETPDICAAAAREDDRIRVIRHPRNIGMVANFNFGLSVRRGDLFMWAGQDDEKLLRFVEATVAALQRNPAAVLACTWTVLMMPDREEVKHPYAPEISSDRLEERLRAFVAERQTIAIYGLFRSATLDTIGPMPYWLDTDRHYLFEAAIRGPFEVVPELLFRYRFIHSAPDYVAMGLPPRPGSTDFDLDLHRYLPQLLREAGLSRDAVRTAMQAMNVPLKPYFARRAEYLIGDLLSRRGPRRRRIALLFGWARQYPPILRTRMFWGALRRLLTSGPP